MDGRDKNQGGTQCQINEVLCCDLKIAGFTETNAMCVNKLRYCYLGEIRSQFSLNSIRSRESHIENHFLSLQVFYKLHYRTFLILPIMVGVTTDVTKIKIKDYFCRK